VTFREAIEQTPHLDHAWRTGLQALRAQDRPHIEAENTRHLCGSVYIDTALQQAEPRANRWDYGIAYQHSNRQNEFVYWVEPHTASDSQVNKVIKKAQWLLEWLKNGGRPMAQFEREIIWVSSGATTFTLNAPRKKQMAEVGLIHRGQKLKILDRRRD
jgi:hypothetical protein